MELREGLVARDREWERERGVGRSDPEGGLLPVKQKQGRVGVPPQPAVELLRR